MKRTDMCRKSHGSLSLRKSLVTLLLVGSFVLTLKVSAQGQTQWSEQRKIPLYHPETDPPILIADQSGIVHAFTFQYLGEPGDSSQRAIMYNQWTAESGWTPPVDILLSPIKNDARLLDVTLDESGVFHLVFFGGDDFGANIYYSQAPAILANSPQAWSMPIVIAKNAITPENGAIAGNGEGKLVVMYSGSSFGRGWYTVLSTDRGETWSEAELVFPVYEKDVIPFYLRTIVSEDRHLHVVWSENDISNHGLAIYYSKYDFLTNTWTAPITLAEQNEAESLGIQAPTIVEHENILHVTYYNSSTGQQYFIRSIDNGNSWSKPVTPFPHVGLNGPGYFVVDSNNDLHYFWGQRITLPQGIIHGLWHSTWQDSGWSDFEAVVSGRKILDREGFTSFDPVTPHVAISGGNEVLATWRTDYGSRGNGVWYSTTVLDAPRLPVLPLATVPPDPEIVENAGIMIPTPESAPQATSESPEQINLPDASPSSLSQDFFVSLVPVILLILLIVILRQISRARSW